MNIHQRFRAWRRGRQINFQFHILRELFLQDHCPFEDPARTCHTPEEKALFNAEYTAWLKAGNYE